MEGIARKAGVGKQTLYRWWPSLSDVALEALIEEAGESCPLPDTGDLRDDLRAYLRGAFRMIREHTGPLLRCLIADAQKNAEFRTRFREGFVRTRGDALASLISRYQPDSDGHYPILDMVFGALWYRLLVGHQPLDDQFAEQLADATVRLLSGR